MTSWSSVRGDKYRRPVKIKNGIITFYNNFRIKKSGKSGEEKQVNKVKKGKTEVKIRWIRWNMKVICVSPYSLVHLLPFSQFSRDTRGKRRTAIRSLFTPNTALALVVDSVILSPGSDTALGIGKIKSFFKWLAFTHFWSYFDEIFFLQIW